MYQYKQFFLISEITVTQKTRHKFKKLPHFKNPSKILVEQKVKDDVEQVRQG